MILHAVEAGQGPPVALLHGLFGRSQNLGALARRLSGRYRTISLDLRNHGASPHAPGMDYASLSGDVRETLAGLGAWPACVLGHSMGGKAAMMLALLHPTEVPALIVGDIAPVAYEHGNRRVAAALQSIALLPGLTRAAADRALAPAVPEAAVRAFLLQNLVFAEKPYWRTGLAHIADAMRDIEGWPADATALSYAGPACFIAGALSTYILPDHRPVIDGMFPASQIVSLPNAGHWLHADQPDAFASLVEQALDAGRDGAPLATGI
jgi:pimeloyl-ACP methyl ester carboxylesterase